MIEVKAHTFLIKLVIELSYFPLLLIYFRKADTILGRAHSLLYFAHTLIRFR